MRSIPALLAAALASWALVAPEEVAAQRADGGGGDYCRISRSHTMCRYGGVSSAACGQPVSRGFSGTERRELVDRHNRLRQAVANGMESRGNPGPQPHAADMQVRRVG